MSDLIKEREKQNRDFLHNMATPITILRLSLSRLEALQNMAASADDGSLSPEASPSTEASPPTVANKQAEVLKRVMSALEKIEEIHANFKVVLHGRENSTSFEAEETNGDETDAEKTRAS